MNDKELYEAAILRWGKPLQVTVAIEEFSELTKVLCKCLRNVKNWDAISPIEFEAVTEEMADAEIMLQQLKVIFHNPDSVHEEKKRKLDRLEERIKAGCGGKT